MVIYLTGATGLAGAAIAEAATRRGHTVIGVGFRSEAELPESIRLLRLDLRKEETIVDSLLDQFPEVIINAAAISSPAACNEHPEDSALLNVQLPAALAKLAHHLSARLIHLSTDMVFDGRSTHYSPGSPTAPTSLYGRQKLEAETRIMERAPEFATIVRTTLLTGNSPGGRRSVHEKLFQTWADGKKAGLFEDEIRQPCLAENLAEVVVEISERNDLFGTYHWAGSEEISRYAIGQRILQHFKLPETLVEKTRIGSDPNLAGRPANLTFDISALAAKLKTHPLPFSAQLETFKVPVPFRAWYNTL